MVINNNKSKDMSEFNVNNWRSKFLFEGLDELSDKQQAIAKLDPPEDELDGGDYKAMGAGEKPKLKEKVDKATLQLDLDKIRKENPGKNVTYDFMQNSPKGYVIYIDGKLYTGGDWPEGVLSRFEDMKFVRKQMSRNGSGATYQIIDLENNDKPIGTLNFGSVKALEDFAKNYIRPQGGRQSSQFESENQAEDDEVSGALNRLHKNKPLKTGDITTIKSGKYKGKKVKITADLGNGRYKIDLVNKDIKDNEGSKAIETTENKEIIQILNL